MEIFKPTIQDQATFSGSVDISGSLTITQNLNVVGELQGAATTASYISLANVDGFTAVSSSIEQRISNQESFSQSLDSTFATDAQVANAVSSLNAATGSYLLNSLTTQTGNLKLTGNIQADTVLSGSIIRGDQFHIAGGSQVIDSNMNFYVADYIYHSGDPDTYIQFFTNGMQLYSGGQNGIRLDNTFGTVINTFGANRIFRVESDTDENAIYVDGATGKVGIGTSSPSTKLAVSGSVTATSFLGIFEGAISGSEQIASDISGSFTSTSASLAGRITSNESSVSALNSASSSYLLNTTDTLTGDLTVTGKITAQEFHTEFVSASILYDSGSTKFGNDVGDIHSFTGSLRVYDDVQVNGTVPLKLIVNGGTANDATEFRNGNGEFKIYSGRTLGGQHQSFVFSSGDNYTSGATRMVISGSNGYIGIGTTTPAYPLDVNGSMRADSYRIGGGTVLSGLTTLYLGSGGATSTIGLVTTSGQGLTLNGGNVGIGTTSPSTKLHILQSGTAVSSDGVSSLVVQKSAVAGTAAAINIVSGDSAEASLRFGDTTDQSMGALRYLNDVDAFSIVTNNNDQVRITSSGNVGIGTTSPSVQLDIEDSGNVIIDLNTTTANANTTIRLQESGNNTATIGYDGTNDGLVLTTGGFTAGNGIFIDNAQNVGIGTKDFGLSSYTGWDNLRLGRTGNLFFNTVTNTFGFAIGRNFYFASDASYKYLTADEAERINFQNGEITFSNATSGTEDSGLSWSVKMVLDADGKLGIGTTSPSEKLQVNGNLQFGDNPIIYWTSNNLTLATKSNAIPVLNLNGSTLYDPRFDIWNAGNTTVVSRINSSGFSWFNGGNVGIGTTGPGTKLDIVSNSQQLRLRRTDSADDDWRFYSWASGLNIFPQTQSTVYFGRDGATTDVNVYNGNLIVQDGNVGIGTTSPDLKLHVAHSDNNNGLLLENSNNVNDYQVLLNIRENEGLIFQRWINGTFNSNLMTIGYDGNVGIGTTSPAQKLHVVGDIRMGTSGVGSILRINRPSDGADAGNVGFFSTSANSDFGLRNGSGGGDIRLYSNDGSLRFYTGASYANQVFRITNSGNVGIGTTSPTQKLHVGNNTANSPHIMVDGLFSNPDAAEHGRVYFNDTNFGIGAGKFGAAGTADDDLYIWAYNGTGRDIRFMSTTNGASAPSDAGWVTNMVIESATSGGKVGIGTSTPNSKLDIRQATDGIALELHNTGGNANDYVDLKMIAGNTTAGTYGTILRHVRQGTGGGDFAILTNPTLTGTPVERLRVDKDGNVGIGTTDPTGKVHVVSSTTSNSGMTNHNGTNTHSVSGVKPGSTSQKLRVFVEIYSTGLLNFSYAHTNSGSCGASLLVYINNSYGTISTNTIHSDLTFCQGTITISTYSPGGGATGAFYEITMPTANGSPAYWAATITGAGNFYFNVI